MSISDTWLYKLGYIQFYSTNHCPLCFFLFGSAPPQQCPLEVTNWALRPSRYNCLPFSTSSYLPTASPRGPVGFVS